MDVVKKNEPKKKKKIGELSCQLKLIYTTYFFIIFITLKNSAPKTFNQKEG